MENETERQSGYEDIPAPFGSYQRPRPMFRQAAPPSGPQPEEIRSMADALFLFTVMQTLMEDEK